MVIKERYQKDKFREQNRQSYLRNKDKIIKSVVKRNKSYYISNPEFKLKEIVRGKTRYKYNKSFCFLCGSKKNLEFHHLSYTTDDFIILCKCYHMKQHYK